MRYRLKLATWVVVREKDDPSPRFLNKPDVAADLARDLLKECDDDKEHFWVILLNTRNRYLMHTLVSTGTQDSSIVHPREVLGPALREGAAALILIHNHPSGDPKPSAEDINLTKNLTAAGELISIRILDHIIIGNGTGEWVSLASQDLL